MSAITQPQRLSTELVVATALRIAEEHGLEAVSLGKVARELGCHVTSLYTHIESIDDLRVRMAVIAQADLADRLWKAALGRSGVDAVRAIADVYRQFGLDQPVFIRLIFAMATTTDDRFRDGGLHLAEPIRATLRGFGLDDRRVTHAHRVFSASMRGFTMAEAQGMYGSDADETFDDMVELFTNALSTGAWPRQEEG